MDYYNNYYEELYHAGLFSALRGRIRDGHKWITRTGTPGHYVYTYAKKVGESIGGLFRRRKTRADSKHRPYQRVENYINKHGSVVKEKSKMSADDSARRDKYIDNKTKAFIGRWEKSHPGEQTWKMDSSIVPQFVADKQRKREQGTSAFVQTANKPSTSSSSSLSQNRPRRREKNITNTQATAVSPKKGEGLGYDFTDKRRANPIKTDANNYLLPGNNPYARLGNSVRVPGAQRKKRRQSSGASRSR